MKVQHAAVLIAGSEIRFTTAVDAMDVYLRGLNIKTSVHYHAHTSVILRAIGEMATKVSEHGVLLIVVNAHGSKVGIEGPSVLSELTYQKIVRALPSENRRVQFVTATCYGQFLIKHLIGCRSGLSTGVITTWEGFKETSDDTIRDVLQAWSNRQLPEEAVRRLQYCGGILPYDSDFMAVQRWGAIHDDYFFAPK